MPTAVGACNCKPAGDAETATLCCVLCSQYSNLVVQHSISTVCVQQPCSILSSILLLQQLLMLLVFDASYAADHAQDSMHVTLFIQIHKTTTVIIATHNDIIWSKIQTDPWGPCVHNCAQIHAHV